MFDTGCPPPETEQQQIRRLESRVEELEIQNKGLSDQALHHRQTSGKLSIKLHNLRPFLRHKRGCHATIENGIGDPWSPCNCGLQDALNS